MTTYLVDGDFGDGYEKIYRDPETIMCKNCHATNRFSDEKCCNCGMGLK